MSIPALPQEIIHQILSNLTTRYLCTLLPTSKSIYLDVTGILHSRLESDLLNKGDHKLIVFPQYRQNQTNQLNSSKPSYQAIKDQFHTICQRTPIQRPNPTPLLPRYTLISP